MCVLRQGLVGVWVEAGLVGVWGFDSLFQSFKLVSLFIYYFFISKLNIGSSVTASLYNTLTNPVFSLFSHI